jgi:hypothetical protein
MKSLNLYTFFFLVVMSTSLNAQEKYYFLDEVYNEITITENVHYATNITVITGSPMPQNLLLDLYEPSHPYDVLRPLIIMFHTGNFLPHPVNNSIGGDKNDSTIVSLAKRLCSMGYVVALAQYRLGWNPVAPNQPTRVSTLINAAYRGVQDANTCIRFFRKTIAEDGNPYSIDDQSIILWGVGTGGYLSANATALQEHGQTLIPKFIGEDAMGNPAPMVSSFLSGNPQGTSVGAPLNIVNYPEYSSEFHLSVNMAGAIGDTSWLKPGDVPMISFHVPTDPVTSCGDGIVIVPPGIPVVEVSGSCSFQRVVNRLGNNQVFKDANFDDVYTQVANSRNDGNEGLYIMPRDFAFDFAPWDWWDPATNANHATGIQTNPDMSFEKSMLYMDTIIGYFSRRAFVALDLPMMVGTKSTPYSQADITLAPNPSGSDILVFCNGQELIREIRITDLNGRIVKMYGQINDRNWTINRGYLPSGMYMVNLVLDDGVLSKKIIFK